MWKDRKENVSWSNSFCSETFIGNLWSNEDSLFWPCSDIMWHFGMALLSYMFQLSFCNSHIIWDSLTFENHMKLARRPIPTPWCLKTKKLEQHRRFPGWNVANIFPNLSVSESYWRNSGHDSFNHFWVFLSFSSSSCSQWGPLSTQAFVSDQLYWSHR